MRDGDLLYDLVSAQLEHERDVAGYDGDTATSEAIGRIQAAVNEWLLAVAREERSEGEPSIHTDPSTLSEEARERVENLRRQGKTPLRVSPDDVARRESPAVEPPEEAKP